MIADQMSNVGAWKAAEAQEPWMELHRQLVSVAKRRAALDSEELALIREAIRVQLWRKFGMSSLREYLEYFMGYGPHVAGERIRVTEALEALPAIEDALATGELSYSAVRELTRIATPKTEEAWLEACEGKNLRQIEELVAEREHGDAPTDDPKPDVRPQRVSMMLRPGARAALRSARQAIEVARGERIDDSELIAELCRGYGAGRPDEAPRAQVAITKCQTCEQAWQHAGGREIAISEAEYQTAACDAVMIGSIAGDEIQRAESQIPPATRRKVKQRDGFSCTVPGCRSSRFLDVHHIVPRELGGDHKPSNLTTLCGGHHDAHHRGDITISGKAPRIAVAWKFKVSHVGESDGERGVKVSHLEELDCERGVKLSHVGESTARDAVRALTTLGAKPGEAKRAVAVAIARAEHDATLEAVVRGALRGGRW